MMNRVNKSPPLDPILSQINIINALPFYLRSTLILYTHLRLGRQRDRFPSAFNTKPLFSPPRATRVVHLNFRDLITLIIFGKGRSFDPSGRAV